VDLLSAISTARDVSDGRTIADGRAGIDPAVFQSLIEELM
jgi:hypothetical protein